MSVHSVRHGNLWYYGKIWKDGTTRFYVNYQNLNNPMTWLGAYLLPHINDSFVNGMIFHTKWLLSILASIWKRKSGRVSLNSFSHVQKLMPFPWCNTWVKVCTGDYPQQWVTWPTDSGELQILRHKKHLGYFLQYLYGYSSLLLWYIFLKSFGFLLPNVSELNRGRSNKC